VLGDAEREFEIAPLAVRRRAFGSPSSVTMSSTTALSRLCTSRPPATVFAVRPRARGSGKLPASRRRKFLRFAMIAIASSVASGAMITSVRISVMTRAASASSVRLTAMMPP